MNFPKIAYPGGKSRLAGRLVSFMPKSGQTYVEPFAGRGNVFWAVAASGLKFEKWRLNDLRTADFFHAIRCIGAQVDVPVRSRDEYLQQWSAYKMQDMRAILLEPYLSFCGGGYAAGMRGDAHGATPENYARTLRACHDLMLKTGVTVTELDWAQLAWDSLTADDFVYFDPPYMDAVVHPYGPMDINHAALIPLLRSARFRWLLSEYRQDLYVQAFGDPFFSKDVQLAVCNHTSGKCQRRLECLWKNY